MVTTQTYTKEDLHRLETNDGDYELIEGELAPVVPPNFAHGDVQARLLYFLMQHVLPARLGKVVGEVGFTLQRDPDSVLAPDLAFIATARLPASTTGFVELAPDLAVEIVSPGNNAGEIERKVAIYLAAGVQAVWVIYPTEKQVATHAPEGPPRVFTTADTIDGADVLPGLDLPITDIFS